MTLTLPDCLPGAAGLTEADLVRELAVTFFEREWMTLGQAAQLCNLPQLDFQRLLASRRIPVHYGPEEMMQDLRRVEALA